MSTGFAKTLLNREVLALSCGAMIGWSWVLLTGEWLARAGTLGLTPQALAVIEGQNYSKGDEMALTLYRAGPAPTGPGEGFRPSWSRRFGAIPESWLPPSA